MRLVPMASDAGVLSGWGAEMSLDYKRYLTPAEQLEKCSKTPYTLTFASLKEDQYARFKDVLPSSWQCVGWYPSIHGKYEKSDAIYLYMQHEPEKEFLEIPTSSFNGVLGCSVGWLDLGPVRKSLASDYRYGPFGSNPGQFRQTLYRWKLSDTPVPVAKFEEEGFRKVAATPIAEYWYFGLKPGEKR